MYVGSENAEIYGYCTTSTLLSPVSSQLKFSFPCLLCRQILLDGTCQSISLKWFIFSPLLHRICFVQAIRQCHGRIWWEQIFYSTGRQYQACHPSLAGAGCHRDQWCGLCSWFHSSSKFLPDWNDCSKALAWHQKNACIATNHIVTYLSNKSKKTVQSSEKGESKGKHWARCCTRPSHPLILIPGSTLSVRKQMWLQTIPPASDHTWLQCATVVFVNAGIWCNNRSVHCLDFQHAGPAFLTEPILICGSGNEAAALLGQGNRIGLGLDQLQALCRVLWIRNQHTS